ncbi:conserved hypothetical protein [Crenothrix polyspora]|uniref:Antitoxin n=1 Tax=Crenothrix polyspora TaxID=360316 RepID=A0A1R4H5U7_9GAMM|nr:DUF6364 family protein [Crenothrix polyspora]SJM91559.1 conserved hypothetical protein [Crenothrix polyspora]
MQTKLTLRLEEELINRAKIYAKDHDKSLSQIVSDYFHLLSQQTKTEPHCPITQALTGIIAGENVSEADYKQHLQDKYL